MNKHIWFLLFLGMSAVMPLVSQTHVSVPLDSKVYPILEQAQLRGLCAPLSGTKPYSRAKILSAIAEILGADAGRAGALSGMERRILETARDAYSTPQAGLDLQRGAYYFENTTGKNDIHISNDIGIRAETLFSLGFGSGFSWGNDIWVTGFILGDMGAHFSYGLTFAGAMFRAPRTVLGSYHTYYDGYPTANNGAHIDEEITAYSQPAAFFPYSYRKRWDGFVFDIQDISSSGYISWPNNLSVGYSMFPEMSGVLLNDHISYRIGRLAREWGGMSGGSSLAFNQAARPFLAFEAAFKPYSWLNFSTLTGVLEFFNEEGIAVSAKTNQNAFSIAMLEINHKQYLHFDAGTTVVWPKRFELGYMIPLVNQFLYQNDIGDFDNLGMFFDLKAQYPGIAGVWASLFMDEVSFEPNMFELDRSMYAVQVGAQIAIPHLPFASLSLRYTKIEPYCYTHTKEILPWYGESHMETAYTNNAEGIGYYLPPNSDEVLLKFEMMPQAVTATHIQYQMIRHGADHGPHAVDGSSYKSELDPVGRSQKPVLRKYFLRDGAYQWLHIVKIGAEHSFAQNKVPLQLFGEAGVVFSYFTDIAGAANSGSPSSYSVVDTTDYPQSISFIVTVGIRLYPQW
jgi:hypothetical protein